MPDTHLPGTFPNFLGIGASKSGTSSLYAYLRQHPDIFVSVPKETQYFTYDEVYALGPEGLVANYFKGAEGHRAIGDITPTYFIASRVVIPRIRESYGSGIPKFILILREPVQRAWSHYLHKVRTGEEAKSFSEAMALEEERMARDPYGWWGYVSEGRYAFHLRPWLDAFPRENFLFLLMEDLATDSLGVLRAVYQFLDVDPDYMIPDLGRQNTAGAAKSAGVLRLLNSPSLLKSLVKRVLPLRYRQRIKTRIIELNTSRRTPPPELRPEIRAQLADYFKSDIEELEALTGLDLQCWKQAHEDG